MSGTDKVVGILTGVSYISGIDYYKGINEEFGRLVGTGTGLMPRNPTMVMASVNCDEYARLLIDKQWDAVKAYLLKGVDMVVSAGADVIGLASNTAHISADVVEKKYPKVPLVHIADCTAARIRDRLEPAEGRYLVGLVGTEPTMRERYLKDRLARHGVDTLVPESDAALTRIFEAIMKELGAGVFSAETRAFFREEILKLRERGAKGVILGCTEIELLIQQEHLPDDFVVFPSAAIHIETLAAVAAGKVAPGALLPSA